MYLLGEGSYFSRCTSRSHELGTDVVGPRGRHRRWARLKRFNDSRVFLRGYVPEAAHSLDVVARRGGIAVGLGGYLDPRVLGVGYGIIHSLLNGQILGTAVLGILIGKALVSSLFLRFWNFGPVLAPLLMVGGAMGALEASFIPVGNVALWATISMAAVMGGTMRAPLTAIVFTLELTHDLDVMPGLLVACMASMAVAVLVMKRSILSEKVARRGHHLVYEYSIDPLTIHRVEEIMVTDVPTVLPSLTADELFQLIAKSERSLVRRQGAPTSTQKGNFLALLRRETFYELCRKGAAVRPF